MTALFEYRGSLAWYMYASTSKAKLNFVPVDKIISVAGWFNTKTFATYYNNRPPDKSAYWKIIFFIYFIFLYFPYVVGTQKNRLNETVLLSTKNTCQINW